MAKLTVQPDESQGIDAAGVGIRPGVRSLALYRHLNYKPWYAVAEFVDNAIQSYVLNREALRSADGEDYRLRIEIDVLEDGRELVILDNAAGINTADYARAFTPSEPPLDVSGLSEFGIGMKSAACWFSPNWSVRTSARGEPFERTITFDVPAIVNEARERLIPLRRPAQPETHYTEVRLRDLFSPLRGGRTIGKIKDHLASIYRQFVRSDEVTIAFNTQELSFDEPDILVAPNYRQESGPPIDWRKDIAFDVSGGIQVTGFAALRAVGTTSSAGFALLRRGRVILGSGDEGYRPESIFGRSNSFASQRLFGELHIKGASVTHTKDGFKWDGREDEFLESLRAAIRGAPLDLLDQAQGYRARVRAEDAQPVAERAVGSMMAAVGAVGADIAEAAADLRTALATGAVEPRASLPSRPTVTQQTVDLRVGETNWHLTLQLTAEQSRQEWLEIVDQTAERAAGDHRERHLFMRISLAHPFMNSFADRDEELLEPILRLATALAVSESVARDQGVRNAGAIRREMNKLLAGALSKPSPPAGA